MRALAKVATAVPSLRIRFKKGGDGVITAFALHRADGTFEVQRSPNPFFPIHDLTHFAIETTLGLRRAFYGLIAEGWGFDDFVAPWARGPLPEEAMRAELLAGYFDLERATGQFVTADDLNTHVAEYYAQRGVYPAPPPIEEAAVTRIRELRGMLAARWRMTPPGESLELSYDPGRPLREDC